MSVHVSSWVWRYAECQDNELLLLLALADMANDEGVAWPSALSVASRCRCDVRTVQRNLARAVERGDIRITSRCAEGKTNVYRFAKYRPPGTHDVTPPPGNGHFGDLPPESSDNRQINVMETSMCARKPDFALSADVPSKKKRVFVAQTDSLEEVAAYAVKIGLTRSDGVYCFNHWRTNGWTIDGRPIQDWKSCMIAWREAHHLPSQKNGGSNGRRA